MIGVFSVGLVAVLGLLWWAIRGPLRASVEELVGALDVIASQLARRKGDGDEHTREVIVDFERRLTGLAEIVDRLPSKWEDVRREADSLYKRTRHHIRRVNDELEARGLEDPELDGLASEVGGVHPSDAGGGDGARVQPVQGDLGPTLNPDPVEALIARKWGA